MNSTEMRARGHEKSKTSNLGYPRNTRKPLKKKIMRAGPQTLWPSQNTESSQGLVIPYPRYVHQVQGNTP